jgi:hypothetical protein
MLSLEISRTLESMDEIVDEGEGLSIFSHDGIECLIVLDEAELTILLDKKDWGT